MIWTIVEEQILEKELKKHAGGKAREDLREIFLDCGIQERIIIAAQRERAEASAARKLFYHVQMAWQWKKELQDIKKGETIIFQFPLINHTLLLTPVLKDLNKKGVQLIAFIHDLEFLRLFHNQNIPLPKRLRMKWEELDELKIFDQIVVHNAHMKELIHNKLGIPDQKMVVLEIFDYLIQDHDRQIPHPEKYDSCIIAGNLGRFKASYIYDLPDYPNFELYGINYEGTDKKNVHYHGSYYAEELPFHMQGGFGLVWDGDSCEKCTGPWGEYLRYNNPHKTSLYLACGIPVIIWEEAAMADFILDHHAGFTVKSLSDISIKLAKLSPDEYRQMKQNALKISVGLRNGEYSRTALERAGICISETT